MATTKIAKSAKGANLVHDPESAFEEIGPQTPRTSEAISSRNIELASGVLPGADSRHSMVASEFEYRHRFWMIVLVYLAAYAFYNLNHVNILYAVVPWNQGVPERDMLVRLPYGAAAVLAAVGAILLTWSTAYRAPSTIKDHTAFSIAGFSAMSGTHSTCPIFS